MFGDFSQQSFSNWIIFVFQERVWVFSAKEEAEREPTGVWVDWWIWSWLFTQQFPRWCRGKESACWCRRCRFNPWVGKIPWSRAWQHALVFSLGKFHGQRSLAGYSHKKLDTTKHAHTCKFRHQGCVCACVCTWGRRKQGLKLVKGGPLTPHLYQRTDHPDRKIRKHQSEMTHFSSVQLFCCVRLFVTPWTAARQASRSIINLQSLLKITSIKSVMPSSRLILCLPFLPPSIFPSIRVFSNESVLPIRWPK